MPPAALLPFPQPWSGERPAWAGLFWSEATAPETISGFKAPPPHRPLVVKLRNLPTREAIGHALAVRPDASRLVGDWRRAWERCVGDVDEWAASKGWKGECEDDTYRGWAVSLARDALDDDPGLTLSRRAWMLKDAETYASVTEERDWRLHIIECASSVLALAHSAPGQTAVEFRAGDDRFRFVSEGTDWDGLPILAQYKHNPPFRQPDELLYWKWKPFLRRAGRHMTVADDLNHAAYVLADMAWQGHSKAFLKASKSKHGTWIVDIDGVRSAKDAGLRIATAMGTAALVFDDTMSMIVQEFVPFTHEHRFFVVEGRVVASTASDRNLCVLDRREGRIVDDRVAVLRRPPCDGGSYDRGETRSAVSRDVVAEMARIARVTSREIHRETGIGDFTLDVGYSARGILPIEVNELERSGRYAVDWDRVVRAASDRSRYADAIAERKVISEVGAIILDWPKWSSSASPGDLDAASVIVHALECSRARREFKVSELNAWNLSPMRTLEFLTSMLVRQEGRRSAYIEAYRLSAWDGSFDALPFARRINGIMLASGGELGLPCKVVPAGFRYDHESDEVVPHYDWAEEEAGNGILKGVRPAVEVLNRLLHGPHAVDWFVPRMERSRNGPYAADRMNPARSPLPGRRFCRTVMNAVAPRAEARVDWTDAGLVEGLCSVWRKPASRSLRNLAVNGRLGYAWLPDGKGMACQAEDVLVAAHLSGLVLGNLAASAHRAVRLTIELARSMTGTERNENGLNASGLAALGSVAASMGSALEANGIGPEAADDWLTVLCLEIGCGWLPTRFCSSAFAEELLEASRDGATLLDVAAASVVAWDHSEIRAFSW